MITKVKTLFLRLAEQVRSTQSTRPPERICKAQIRRGMRAANIIGGIILVSSTFIAKGLETTTASNMSVQSASLGYMSNFSTFISIGPDVMPNAKHQPVCYVELKNNRAVISHYNNYKTNCDWFLDMPRENLFGIELFDSPGNSVTKNERGLQFGLPLTSEEITEWRNRTMNPTNFPQHEFVMICPGESLPIGFFGIPEMFLVKQPGEYTLHVRTRLIQGTQFTWLPEATAKVQIRPEDIAPKSSLPNTQTNSLAK
jgi:hypothetical protein